MACFEDIKIPVPVPVPVPCAPLFPCGIISRHDLPSEPEKVELSGGDCSISQPVREYQRYPSMISVYEMLDRRD